LEAFRNSRQWTKVLQNLNLINYHTGFANLFDKIAESGTKIGIITNSPRNYAVAVLAACKIQFDALVAYHDVRNRKPHPEPFLKILSLLNLKAEECISIGDTDHDMTASRSASIRCIGAKWYTPTYSFTTAPDVIVTNVEDILNHLK
jgi:HAD superfamily hydrolase (TIGR01549 family)